MQRRSYFPHNQQLISTATATSSGLASSRPTTPANDLRVENGGLRVETHDDDGERDIAYRNSLDLSPPDDPSKDHDMGRVDRFHERAYP